MLEPIETEKEWKIIQTILDELQASAKEQAEDNPAWRRGRNRQEHDRAGIRQGHDNNRLRAYISR